MASESVKRNNNASNPFAYGFKVHSLSQVNHQNAPKSQPATSQKGKNKKNSPKNRKKQAPPQQEQASPFSTSTSPVSIELYSSSVSRLLDPAHLDASSATSLHDLQCGTATAALQAFLSFTNLRKVLGIEQNKNLFHWATQNLLALVKNGYEDNRYLLVENIPSTKMTIAQKSSEAESQKKVFAVGDIVYCFIPLKSNNIKKRDNYQGVIRSVHDDGIHYDVEMAATKTVTKKVHRESVFKPGTERVFEVVRGNLFERSDSFRSDIILLPYSISNDSFRSLLLTGCKRAPIGSRILSFSHLESWDGFPSYQLRRVDANVYDNDRYDTNLSPHQRLYLYEHVLSPNQASSPKDIAQHCAVGSHVTVRDPKQQRWFSADVIALNNATKTITINKDGFLGDTGIEEIKIDEQRLHLIRRRFAVNDLVTAYCMKMIETEQDDMYTLYRGQVVAHKKDGTYLIQYEDGEQTPAVPDVYIFRCNRPKYEEGDVCIASRYDNIRECNDDGELINLKQLMEKETVQENQCVIRHVNPDGTYRVEFVNVRQYPYHDSFCESFLRSISEIISDDDTKFNHVIEPRLPLNMEIDYDKVLQWRPNLVAHWLNKCGVQETTTQILKENKVNGVFLFDLDVDLLTQDMKIAQQDAKQILLYMRLLKSKLHLSNEEEQQNEAEITQLSIQLQQAQQEMKQIEDLQQHSLEKLDKLMKANQEDVNKLKEYELKLKCVHLKNKKVPPNNIASQLKKSIKWVQKMSKLKPSQIKKPTSTAIKQMEALQAEISNYKRSHAEKQTQYEQARMKLRQFTQ
eukprot:CAMPEP_0197031312 /NCGR_PEP_ID=MMETSP1384-20130603/10356_1 /TAXON_ID=29189 /ORGANISM="Ammonia sp." /LENGTH=798 /DNA_ID=CAMNT_0042460823 /DNA_START=9 /DNA_END=2405 /DNA_ORIENTATION=-